MRHPQDTRSGGRKLERIETVVIGGGQAGLSVGYHLARRGLSFVILDASERIGDAWRARWDSLRLFTTARYNGLPGLGFPAPKHDFITKDQMADYLEGYAAHFELPVRSGVRVERLSRRGGRFLVTTDEGGYEADNVVVAMANHQQPRVPPFAPELDEGIVQLHSSAYKNLGQLQPGGVLIVGAGNSGSEIAMETARAHPTWMSGRHNGHIPFRIESAVGKHLLVPLVLRVIFHRVLTVGTPLGRAARPGMLTRGGPLVRVKPRDLDAVGVERIPRTVGVQNGLPLLEDGRTLEVANVIWCSGYHPGFSWIDLPIFEEDGELPHHHRGVVAEQPGLYFVGLHFLSAVSSEMVHGVSRDAQRIVAEVASRSQGVRRPSLLPATS